MKNRIKHKLHFFVFITSLVLLCLAILFVLHLKSQESDEELNNNVVGIDELISNETDTLPEDFPIYKDSELVTSAVSDDGMGGSFIWETEDEAGLVYEYLKSELRIGGWSLYDESSVGSSSAVSFEKEGSNGFLGVFIGSGGKTIISVSIRKP